MVPRSAPAFAGYVGGRSRALQMCQPLCGSPVCQPPRHPTPPITRRQAQRSCVQSCPPKPPPASPLPFSEACAVLAGVRLGKGFEKSHKGKGGGDSSLHS